MKWAIISKVYLTLVMVLIAPNFVFADVGEKPSVADARKVYEDRVHEAISKGLVRISSFEKTDGQSREVFGVKVYSMDVGIVLEFLKNVAVCSSSMEGTIQIIPEAEYNNRMNYFCVTKFYKTGGRLAVIGSVDFEKTEKRWKAGKGAFQVQNLDAALCAAVLNKNLSVVKSLITKGADVNAVKDPNAVPVLMLAASQGNVEIFKFLLDHGANVNGKSLGKKTALMFAASDGEAEIVKILLAKGADVNATDNKGWSALMSAAGLGKKVEIVKMLLAQGADVNAKNNHDITALMLAAGLGDTEIVKILLDKGADVNAKDSNGKSALNKAMANGKAGNAKMLRDNGAYED